MLGVGLRKGCSLLGKVYHPNYWVSIKGKGRKSVKKGRISLDKLQEPSRMKIDIERVTESVFEISWLLTQMMQG